MSKYKFDYRQYYSGMKKSEALQAAEEFRRLAIKRFRSAKKGQLVMDEFRAVQRYLAPLKSNASYNEATARVAKLRAFLRSEVSTRKGYDDYVRRGMNKIENALGLHILSGYSEETFDRDMAGRLICDFEDEVAARVLTEQFDSDPYSPTGKGAAVRDIINQVLHNRADYIKEEVQMVQVAPGVYRPFRRLVSTKADRLAYIDELIAEWKKEHGYAR